MNDQQLPKPTISPQPTPTNLKQGQDQQITAPKADGNEMPPPSAMKQPAPPAAPTPAQAPTPAPAPTPAQAQAPIPTAVPQAQSRLQPQQQSQMTNPVLPPTSLSALSSMSSTQLPEGQPPTQGEPLPDLSRREGDIRAQASLPQQPQKARPASALEDPAEKNPKFAKAKNPIFKYLPFVGIAIVVLAVLGFAAMKFLGGGSQSVSTDPGTGGTAGQGGGAAAPTQQVTIEYWGLWEPNEVMNELISDFESKNQGIQVKYVNQSHKDYRQRLQTAIASGNGPDIFRFHASWVPMLKDNLASIPTSVISPTQFKEIYYPVASKQLQSNGQIVGIPSMYDGVALLYNKDILSAAGENPPTSWSDMRTLASKLTVRSGDTVTRAGVALGSASNVDHFSDILAILMLQNGADLAQPNSVYSRDAFKFYTNFLIQDKVWSETLPNSTVAFARGDVAMIFAPSWRIHEILAMNPNMNLGVAPVPSLGEEKIAWATYWAEGMSAVGKNKEASALFLKYLTSKEALTVAYSAASQVRAFGEIYPRIDMANDLADDEYLAAYLEDALIAEGWYLSSSTHDNGINDLLIKYYEDAINAMVKDRKDAESVLTTVDSGTKQVLRQYGVSAQ